MRQTPNLLGIAALILLAGCFTLDLDDDGDIDIPPRGGFETDYISCSNGRDDDLDGRIDCEDSDCLMRGHCGEQIPLLPPAGYENTFETCSNGIDDDPCDDVPDTPKSSGSCGCATPGAPGPAMLLLLLPVLRRRR